MTFKIEDSFKKSYNIYIHIYCRYIDIRYYWRYLIDTNYIIITGVCIYYYCFYSFKFELLLY